MHLYVSFARRSSGIETRRSPGHSSQYNLQVDISSILDRLWEEPDGGRKRRPKLRWSQAGPIDTDSGEPQLRTTRARHEHTRAPRDSKSKNAEEASAFTPGRLPQSRPSGRLPRRRRGSASRSRATLTMVQQRTRLIAERRKRVRTEHVLFEMSLKVQARHRHLGRGPATSFSAIYSPLSGPARCIRPWRSRSSLVPATSLHRRLPCAEDTRVLFTAE